MQFYGVSCYHCVNATLTLKRARSRSRSPLPSGSSTKSCRRKGEELAGVLRAILRSNFCDIAATTPLRSRLEANTLADSVDSLSSQPRLVSKRPSAMILDEDLYPPRHKTVIKYRTTTQQSTQNSSSLSPQHDAHTWLDGLNSPLIQDEGDSKMLKLRFDVSQYTPEEIVVKTVDNKLLVHAKHEEKTESKSVYREYNREFLLPKGTNPESIKSSLSKDGVLTVEAPLPAIGAGEKLIPIAHQ
ncbi:heat shock protein beta-1 isoform X1 [Odontomachus brunneus]|uniref:heat shock protein beta-1 isoform X1 n=1 Tax=Odontomachus brunneus TaxID=486640 RepID=UPI0013F1EC2A|nr:heat shock protein beta-1 isoform X1 [Odontomachus brunneus]